jgi:hypothetical protein
MEPLAHPLTGQVIDAKDGPALLAAVEDALEEAGRLFRLAGEIRDRAKPLMAHLAGTTEYELPKPRNRTAKQQKLASCPRCGDKIRV